MGLDIGSCLKGIIQTHPLLALTLFPFCANLTSTWALFCCPLTNRDAFPWRLCFSFCGGCTEAWAWETFLRLQESRALEAGVLLAIRDTVQSPASKRGLPGQEAEVSTSARRTAGAGETVQVGMLLPHTGSSPRCPQTPFPGGSCAGFLPGRHKGPSSRTAHTSALESHKPEVRRSFWAAEKEETGGFPFRR